MSRYFRPVFWTAALFAFVMALLPQPPQLPGTPSDKVQHIAAFATLAALGSAAYPSASLIRFLVCLSAFGALIEVLQAVPALNRDNHPVDWLADTIAAGSVLAAVSRWRNYKKRPGR